MSKKTELIIDVKAEISQIKQKAQEMEKLFSGLNLSSGVQKSLSSTFSKLGEEVRKFEAQTNKGFSSLADTKKAEKNFDNIVTLFEQLKVQIKDIGNSDLSKMLPTKAINDLKEYKNILKQIDKLQSKDNSKAIGAAQKKVEDLKNDYQKAKAAAEGFKGAQVQASQRKSGYQTNLNKLPGQIDKATQKLNEFYEVEKKTGKSNKAIEQSARYIKLANDIKLLTEKRGIYTKAIKTENDNISKNATEYAKAAPQVENLRQQYEEASTALQNLKDAGAVSQQELAKLASEIARISGTNIKEIPTDLQGMADKIQQLISESSDTSKISEYLNLIKNAAQGCEQPLDQTRQKVYELGQSGEEVAKVSSEMDMLKSRLTYFFSAMNGFQLFKNAIRDAYNSIKDLDKAMTETAVVTKMSVQDLWNEMPRYTKIANDLGTTTLGAYQAMTLYYQQGLDNAEATALTTETLKMARIAGLEAAESTDLMTAALRGFNMELNETSAQRVNDVYSNLAANAAANTQEIADAMTRTASIANSAGMSFENTAAFLTQMINFATYTRVA